MSTLTIKNGPLEGAWQTSSGKGVAVHFLEGSYPARRAAAEMRDAERAIAALEELLAPPLEHRGRPIHIYLTDAVASDVDLADARAAAPAVTAEQGILRVVQPDAPAEAIAYALTRRLVGRWFGQKAARATLFVNGIAGVVAGRTGAAPNPGDTDEWVRDERAAGRDVSIFTRERERAAAAYPDAADPLATSFLGFLIEAYGAERLRAFLAAYDPERRDQAAAEAYQRPLGSLEELWLARLSDTSGSRSAFRCSSDTCCRSSSRTGFAGRRSPSTCSSAWLTRSRSRWRSSTSSTRSFPAEACASWLSSSPPSSASWSRNTLVTVRRSYVTALVNQRILLGLQERMFERLQRLSHDFYARAKVGDLMSRLSNDLNAVEDAIDRCAGPGRASSD